MKDTIFYIFGWIVATLLLLPLVPLIAIGFVLAILAVPICVIVGVPLVLCRVHQKTLNLVIDTVRDVCFAPLRLALFAGKGLSDALNGIGKENEG